METDSPIVPEFNSWLEELVKGEGSDLHVKVGSPPMLRLPHGLIRLERDPLSPLETQAIADGIVPQDRRPILLRPEPARIRLQRPRRHRGAHRPRSTRR